MHLHMGDPAPPNPSAWPADARAFQSAAGIADGDVTNYVLLGISLRMVLVGLFIMTLTLGCSNSTDKNASQDSEVGNPEKSAPGGKSKRKFPTPPAP